MPKKVYLKPKELAKHSRHHTAYVGEGAVSGDGTPKPLYKLEFWGGVAEKVDEGLFRRFEDAGIASTSKPSVGEE